VKFSTTFVLAGLLAGALALPGLTATAQAHDKGNENGKSKHNFCYDKHGRWRSHPHCPAPRQSHAHQYYGYREPSYSHYHHRDYTRDRYERRPTVIYVRKDSPYDYRGRYIKPPVRDNLRTVDHARSEVRQGREQLRRDRVELRRDRAELRRDIRNRTSKQEIRNDRQEIRDDLRQIKSTRREIRNDRADLDMAHRELARR
jgi:hypothetical protein